MPNCHSAFVPAPDYFFVPFCFFPPLLAVEYLHTPTFFFPASKTQCRQPFDSHEAPKGLSPPLFGIFCGCPFSRGLPDRMPSAGFQWFFSWTILASAVTRLLTSPAIGILEMPLFFRLHPAAVEAVLAHYPHSIFHRILRLLASTDDFCPGLFFHLVPSHIPASSAKGFFFGLSGSFLDEADFRLYTFTFISFSEFFLQCDLHPLNNMLMVFPYF